MTAQPVSMVRREPAVGFWSAVVSVWERLERTERGYVWLSKLGPAVLFGLVALVKGAALYETLVQSLDNELDFGRGLYALYLATGLIFFGLVAMLYVLRRRPLRRVEGPLQGLCALMGSYILMPMAVSARTVDDQNVLLAAALLLVVGTAGAATALASLGRCFGIFPEARGLVTHGLYRQVRHPMYLFEFMAFMGVLMPAFSPLNAFLYAIFAVMQLARMRYEEHALATAFPDEYPAYHRRTARLIPGLY